MSFDVGAQVTTALLLQTEEVISVPSPRTRRALFLTMTSPNAVSGIDEVISETAQVSM